MDAKEWFDNEYLINLSTSVRSIPSECSSAKPASKVFCCSPITMKKDALIINKTNSRFLSTGKTSNIFTQRTRWTRAIHLKHHRSFIVSNGPMDVQCGSSLDWESHQLCGLSAIRQKCKGPRYLRKSLQNSAKGLPATTWNSSRDDAIKSYRELHIVHTKFPLFS